MTDPSHDESLPRSGPGAVFSVEATLQGDHAVVIHLEHRDHDQDPWIRRRTLPLPRSGRYAMAVDGLKKRLRFLLGTDGRHGDRAQVTIEKPHWRHGPAGENEPGREAGGKE